MKRILLLSFMFTCIIVYGAWAQRTVSGKITAAEDGSGIPGVNVILKGTAIGTTSDIDGNYRLSVPEEGGTLVFSFIGLATQEIEIGARSVIDVTMQSDVKQLTEVVVTAQGVERSEKSLGYAATSVAGEEFAKTSQVDPMRSLQGKVPGVMITGGGGAPGASTKVIIRGYSSVTGNNNPLYVVDGTPINNDSRTSVLSGLDLGNRANDINPNDIASMTVLKGAAATNLYGPRGANGVIIITTKRGKPGEGLKVEFNSSVTMSDVLRLPQPQSIFGQGWSGHWARNENGSWGPKMDGSMRPWGSVVDNSQKVKPFAPVEDNVYEFYDYGKQFYNSVSVSGGSEKSIFYLSYSNSTTDGVIPTEADKDTRHILKFNGRTTADKLSIATSLSYVRRDGSLIPDGYGGTNAAANLFSELLQIPRDFSVVDFEDYHDKFNNLDNFYSPFAFNPYYAVNENQTEFFENRLYGNVTLDYDFFDWLSAKWIVGTDVSALKRGQWEAIMRFSPGSYQDANGTLENPGMYLEETRETRNLETDFILSANRRFGAFTLDAYLGYNARLYRYELFNTQANTLVIPGFYNLDNTSSQLVSDTYVEEQRLIAGYGNVTFGYNDYLFMNLGGRYDKASTLPKGKNGFFYPKASVSWIASESVPAITSALDYLKLRASWGKAGNDAPPYALSPVMAATEVIIPFSSLKFPLNGVGAYEIGNIIGNPNLQPEITTAMEVGVKASAFNNRVSTEVSVYKRISDGQILTADIAPSSGYLKSYTNFGKVENKGVEVFLSVVPVRTGSFSWTATATYFKNKNKVYDLPDGQQEMVLTFAYDAEYVAIEGMPLGQIRVPDFLRDDEGHIIVNADNGIPLSTTEKKIIGDVQPNYILGIVNEFSYKNFNLSFTLDYRPGGLMYSGTADLHYFTGNATQTTFNERQPFLIPNSVKENPNYDPNVTDSEQYIENDVPINMTNVSAYYYHSQNPTSQFDRIIPRGFLKLRDVNFSYTLPTEWLAGSPVSAASLFFSGRNLLLWTPEENNFIDPESTSFGNDLEGDFGEFRTGPTYRSFTLGLRATF